MPLTQAGNNEEAGFTNVCKINMVVTADMVVVVVVVKVITLSLHLYCMTANGSVPDTNIKMLNIHQHQFIYILHQQSVCRFPPTNCHCGKSIVAPRSLQAEDVVVSGALRW